MQILTQPVTQPAMSALIRPAIGLSLFALVVCGFGYSAIATKIGQAIFPEQAHGSLIKYKGKVVGSKLVAQPLLLLLISIHGHQWPIMTPWRWRGVIWPEPIPNFRK